MNGISSLAVSITFQLLLLMGLGLAGRAEAQTSPLQQKGSPSSEKPPQNPSWKLVMADIDRIVQEYFCFPDRIGQEWKDCVLHFSDEANSSLSLEEFSIHVNHAIRSLHTSHTQLFTIEDPELYELLGVFNQTPGKKEENLRWLQIDRPEEFGYAGIGLRTQRVDDAWYVRDLLPLSPAKQAEIQIGDRLISVDGQPFHPFKSFQGKQGKDIHLHLVRHGQPTLEKQVTVQWYSPDSMFHDAIDQSIEVIDHESQKIGYIRMWSYAGEAYHDRLVEHLLNERLSECEVLVLDLRGGWGGASTSYLTLFDRQIPSMAMVNRQGERSTFPTSWTKPVVLLIDETVRSGKEAFTFGFKKLGLGPVVGQRTAGAVTAGMTFKLDRGCLLYCAVAQCEIDGINLEGVGVEPTIHVDWNWQQCDGIDAIKRQGIEEAKKLLP